ncbi:MAG: DUF2092 domain-containing protein [Phycisphaerales bacterium]|nr:MAG: DUF2092 domain-containing protein [Phycisphaerales bacterium]
MIRKHHQYGMVIVLLIAAAGLVAAYATAQPKASGDAEAVSELESDFQDLIEPQVAELMHDVSDYIAAAKSFSFRAEITFDDVLFSGQKIEHGGTLEVAVRRPDRFYFRYAGDTFAKQYWYDGRHFTVLDEHLNLYATAPAPPTLDETLTEIRDKLDVRLPLGDFAFDDPYAPLAASAQIGFHVGRHTVRGIECQHMAFGGAVIDFQVWIEDSQRLLPRKVVIDHIMDPAVPKYSAFLSEWNLSPRLPDRLFEAKLPEGAERIDFAVISPPEDEPEAPESSDGTN